MRRLRLLVRPHPAMTAGAGPMEVFPWANVPGHDDARMMFTIVACLCLSRHSTHDGAGLWLYRGLEAPG